MSDRGDVMTIAIMSFASGYMFAERHTIAACFAAVVTLYKVSSYLIASSKPVERGRPDLQNSCGTDAVGRSN
jgi:hypothetical protein